MSPPPSPVKGRPFRRSLQLCIHSPFPWKMKIKHPAIRPSRAHIFFTAHDTAFLKKYCYRGCSFRKTSSLCYSWKKKVARCLPLGSCSHSHPGSRSRNSRWKPASYFHMTVYASTVDTCFSSTIIVYKKSCRRWDQVNKTNELFSRKISLFAPRKLPCATYYIWHELRKISIPYLSKSLSAKLQWRRPIRTVDTLHYL